MISASTGVGLVVGVFFGILTLLLGYAFVAMVSPAVQMWVNRSILGKPSEREDMQVLPFDDMASEQSSLEMVFQGIVVNFSYSRVVVSAQDYPSPYEKDAMEKAEHVAGSLYKRNVELTIIVPNRNYVSVSGVLVSASNGNRLAGFDYKKDDVVNDFENELSLGEGDLVNKDFSCVKDESGNYKITGEEVVDIEEVGGGVVFRINASFNMGRFGSSQDAFELEF